MCQILIQNSKFLDCLLRVDQDLAAARRSGGCECGGVLHQAHYPRKPRGVPKGVWGEDVRRFSFCCSACRKRSTAESVRFLGRRVWLALAVVLVTPRTATKAATQLSQRLAVPMRTLERWRQWWRSQFPQTRFWQAKGARWMPPVAIETLPGSLLERFEDVLPAQRMMRLLWFIRPLTVGSPIRLNEV